MSSGVERCRAVSSGVERCRAVSSGVEGCRGVSRCRVWHLDTDEHGTSLDGVEGCRAVSSWSSWHGVHCVSANPRQSRACVVRGSCVVKFCPAVVQAGRPSLPKSVHAVRATWAAIGILKHKLAERGTAGGQHGREEIGPCRLHTGCNVRALRVREPCLCVEAGRAGCLRLSPAPP